MEKNYFDFVETKNEGSDIIFVGKECSMIEICDTDYDNVAEIMKDAIGDRGFFNGSVEYECDRFFSSLTATLIAYHTEEPICGDTEKRLTDAVPVWWEFTTTCGDDSAPAFNDFSFSELRKRFHGGR